jgi:hypothetical protein
MKVRRLILVGLLLSLLLLPWTSAWADTESQDEPVWNGWVDTVDTVVQWIVGLVTDDTDTNTFTLEAPDPESQLQTQIPTEQDRHGGLDPDSNTAK